MVSKQKKFCLMGIYFCDPKEVNGMINLDFDGGGNLVGIEVIDASKKLPKELIDNPDIT